MGHYMKTLCLTFLFVILLGGPVFSDHDSRYVRLRYLEGDVTLYPSDGQRPGEATINMPLLDGDELVTRNGRAELAFRNGIIVRLGDYSGIRLDSSYSPMSMELREGTLFVDSHLVDSFREELVIRAGNAEVFLIDEGVMRVDLGTEGSVRVTSLQGEVEVRAEGRRVLLESGERTYVDPGSPPDRPMALEGTYDELDDWNQERMDRYARRYQHNYLRQDIYYDAYDLDYYGDWRTYGSFGYVWVPHVSFGWRPYYNGRWVYCSGGWFWVSYEPWGWAPYHYGRWGWAIDIGWYWIPGYTFAPAWVSWYDYGDFIGWCPLNYWNRPIIIYNNYNYFYPRVQKQKTLSVGNAWTFVKKAEIGTNNITKAIIDPDQLRLVKIDETKIIKSPHPELVSYVLPKTIKGPALIKDERMIHHPGDIKRPIGSNYRENQFQRNFVDRDRIKGNTEHTDRDVKPDSDQRDQEFKPVPRPDRDDQFYRKIAPDSKQNSEKVKPFHYQESPYYRDQDRNDSPSWFKDPDSYREDHDYESELNPRYKDEARKVFERLYENRRSEGYSGSSYGSGSKYQRRETERSEIKSHRGHSTFGGSSMKSGGASQKSRSGSSVKKKP